MGGGILFCILSGTANSLLDEVELKLGRLTEEPLKPKRKSETRNILTQGIRNGGWNLILCICPEKVTHF
jgi:hypothetical protein